MSAPAHPDPAALPILYSFRRCPYAMRARLALAYSGTHCILREVLLRNKPQALLDISPKGTVPVLVTTEGSVLDESLDIMEWALARHDPASWCPASPEEKERTDRLIKINDGPFKYHLDRYKYPGRYDNEDPAVHRQHAFAFIGELDKSLSSGFLGGTRFALADAAILPFVRQFAATDANWFQEAAPERVKDWLADFLDSSRLAVIMEKVRPWDEHGDHDTPPHIFPASVP